MQTECESRVRCTPMVRLSIHSASSRFNIFFASGSLTSLWRGTASVTPLLGFVHRAWLPSNQRFEAGAQDPCASSYHDPLLNRVLREASQGISPAVLQNQ